MAHPLYRKFLHWTRTLHTYATMLALILLIFFSFTGFVMNHALFFGTDKNVKVVDTTAKTNMPVEIASDTSADRDMKMEVYLRSREGARGERTYFGDEGDATRVQFTGAGSKMEYEI